MILSAKLLAAGLSVFEISHSMSSTKTAESAMLVEKVMPARVLVVGFSRLILDDCSRKPKLVVRS